MSAVDLSTHPGHLARRLQQAHTLLWNTHVSAETTSPQFAVLNAVAGQDDLDQRMVGDLIAGSCCGCAIPATGGVTCFG